MKSLKFIFFVYLITFMILPTRLFANPPSTIFISYDSDLNVLVGQVNHSVLDPTEHFINRVVISINGSIIYDNSFEQQTDRDSLNIPPINIDANSGDIIKVTAYCNKFGNKTINYIVKDDSLKGM